MKLRTGIVALVAAGLTLTACGSDSDDEAAAPSAPASDASGTLKVWLMDGSQPQSVVDTVNAEFKTSYPNVEVQVELQQWSGIQDKLTTSLGTDSTPDVVEIGNSLTAKYADAGLLAEQDAAALRRGRDAPRPAALGRARRHPLRHPLLRRCAHRRLQEERLREGRRRGPDHPRRAQQVAGKLQEDNSDNSKYSAFYFPGKYWYGAVPFVWDAGGDIAVQDGEEWTGTIDSAESRAGLNTLNDLVQSYSKAPKDGDETKNLDAFNTGNVGMMIDSWWAPGVLDAPDAKFAGDIGVFALPGSTTESTAPVFFGGSDLAVSARSSQVGLASEWVKILTNLETQTQLAKEGGIIPNQEGAFVGHEGNEFLMIADEASKVSKFTPVSPCWGNVESSGVLQDMLVKIFTEDATIDEATAEASGAITETLNGC